MKHIKCMHCSWKSKPIMLGTCADWSLLPKDHASLFWLKFVCSLEWRSRNWDVYRGHIPYKPFKEEISSKHDNLVVQNYCKRWWHDSPYTVVKQTNERPKQPNVNQLWWLVCWLRFELCARIHSFLSCP